MTIYIPRASPSAAGSFKLKKTTKIIIPTSPEMSVVKKSFDFLPISTSTSKLAKLMSDDNEKNNISIGRMMLTLPLEKRLSFDPILAQRSKDRLTNRYEFLKARYNLMDDCIRSVNVLISGFKHMETYKLTENDLIVNKSRLDVDVS